MNSIQFYRRPEIQNKDKPEEYGSGLEDSEILDNMPPSEPVFNINPENKEIKTLRETCKSLRDQVRELEDVINKQASDSVKLKVNKNIYMYMYIFFGLHLHSKFSLKGFPKGGGVNSLISLLTQGVK